MPLVVLLSSPSLGAAPANGARFSVVEKSFAELQESMAEGRTTARAITTQYLQRIARYNDDLKAALAVNDRALEYADLLDRERAAGRLRGPLHGIPIALKDLIQTTDMPTTGGAQALRGYLPPYDATLTRKLRDAGAVIIAKTTLTELANWMGTDFPNGYNAIAGHSYNPYDPRLHPTIADGRGRLDTGGSSSAIGTAANLWAANVGTETSGSIMSPASTSWLVGIKPTVGRISRYGVIPLTADQDTPGPMARSLADAAVLLAAMEGPDPADPATGACRPLAGNGAWTGDAIEDLSGLRIGIPQAFYVEPVTPPGQQAPVGGLSAAGAERLREAGAALEALGATVIEPADIPSITAPRAVDNFLSFGICAYPSQVRGADGDCSLVAKYGMKRDFNRWLATQQGAAPFASLDGLIAMNRTLAPFGATRYGQARLELSATVDLARDRERYLRDRARDLRLARAEGIDAALEIHALDALLFPAAAGARLINKAGYPAVTVPFGSVSLSPDGADGDDPASAVATRPWAVTFAGGACEEPKLLRIAAAFERVTRARQPPPAFP
ncbi:amidase family protein [Pseudohaliea sp.]|uniref:amidase family protein n=1 Tax=Pseudohaliea sp. TaxID=2740289 RepID=UPI0032EF52A8